MWNHDPDRLEYLAAKAGGSVFLHLRWQLVQVPSPGGRYCICVCRPEKRTPCGRRKLPGAKQHTEFVRPPAGIEHLASWEKDQANAEVVESLLEGILDQAWSPEASSPNIDLPGS